MDIDHHSPRPISIICHFPDPPSFSLPTTFNVVVLRRNLTVQYLTATKPKHHITTTFPNVNCFTKQFQNLNVKTKKMSKRQNIKH